MDMKKTFVLALGMLSSYSMCVAATSDGIAKVFPGKPPLLFTPSSLSKADEVQVEVVGKGGKQSCCAKAIIEKEVQADPDDFSSDNLSERKVHVYRMKFINPVNYPDPFIGIAVIGKNINVQMKGKNYQVTDEQTISTVSTCYSAEGMHLIRQEGKKKLGHLYLSLGYEVEPDCPAKL
ncbi:hypothetical protein [Undibacterium sp. TS12]|uniref:hypothetical protein n=1 Tax=Undibacterium sp. TS12 TaxID=2908202 RepID=UPI001F4D164F|nr:hypothetical protein [Undibacterium sp. TS12]MCH8622623.1 hypothetical protein [Undibacterium sp. TS12]